jgi:DNA-binding transcriptional LysR family regulator
VLEHRVKGINPPSRNSLPPFEALRAFDAVARLRGVRRAAQSLGRDHAVISRHLRALETWTGTALIERTSSGVVLTEDGARYHERVAVALDLLAEATTDLVHRGSEHRLHIWCMPGFALHWMSRRVGAFERLDPSVQIEIRPTDRSPDFASHETDIDIRFVATYRTPLDLGPKLRSVEIARVPIVAVASPDYLEAAEAITKPADLARHRLLHEDNFDPWSSWLSVHGIYENLDLSGPRLWQGHLTLDAALHGRGIALANYLVAADELAAGRLVEVGKGLESFQPYSEGVYQFIARADRWDAPLIRRYRRWLIDTIAKSLTGKS